ncbi:MAG TPA: RnfABCDGE type electron transport complex subunit B [Casimicrobiaceae bacterium]|nr:RnfABCDGE type electron transport complex subunit B [Casimicrobiaceae bacterium]
MDPALAERLDAALPQTQCTRCGYAACRPYANAIANGVADINRCPPGGDATIAALAAISGRPVRALDPACGAHTPLAIAKIDEGRCIGCTLCIDACPVDAILGASKSMHVVLTALCSGCELCIAPCPVDCIAMVPAGRAWTKSDANAARNRHATRVARRARAESIASRGSVVRHDTAAQRKATVAAALERARARRAR